MTENHRQPPTTITNYKTTYNHLQKNEKIHSEHCFYHFNAHRKCCLARASRKLRIQLVQFIYRIDRTRYYKSVVQHKNSVQCSAVQFSSFFLSKNYVFFELGSSGTNIILHAQTVGQNDSTCLCGLNGSVHVTIFNCQH